jgi:hypothetical protein
MTMIEHHKTLWYNSAYVVNLYVAKTGEEAGELEALLKARNDMSAGPDGIN